MDRLKKYCNSGEIKSVDFIHGDFWFSNILLTFQNTFQFIDMKGICWKTHTTGGDPMYDYAKLYQSFLGYDTILYNGWQEESEYGQAMRSYYEHKLHKLNINLESVKAVTFALILGTLPFIEEKSKQETIWNWAKSVFMPRIPED